MSTARGAAGADKSHTHRQPLVARVWSCRGIQAGSIDRPHSVAALSPTGHIKISHAAYFIQPVRPNYHTLSSSAAPSCAPTGP